MTHPKKSKPPENPVKEEPADLNIPDRHFRHTEPESDYSMDELDRKDDDLEEDPGFDEIRKEQDDDE
jgi:hypothetical protein